MGMIHFPLSDANFKRAVIWHLELSELVRGIKLDGASSNGRTRPPKAVDDGAYADVSKSYIALIVAPRGWPPPPCLSPSSFLSLLLWLVRPTPFLICQSLSQRILTLRQVWNPVSVLPESQAPVPPVVLLVSPRSARLSCNLGRYISCTLSSHTPLLNQ